MAEANGAEVSPVERGDGPDAETLGRRHERRVNRSQGHASWYVSTLMPPNAVGRRAGAVSQIMLTSSHSRNARQKGRAVAVRSH